MTRQTLGDARREAVRAHYSDSWGAIERAVDNLIEAARTDLVEAAAAYLRHHSCLCPSDSCPRDRLRAYVEGPDAGVEGDSR